jgi:chromosome segregation ATPase
MDAVRIETIIAIVTIFTALLTAIGGFFVNRSSAKKNNADIKKDTSDATSAAIEAMTDLINSQQGRIRQLHEDIKIADDTNNEHATKLKEAITRLELAECSLREVQTNLKAARDMITELDLSLVQLRLENETLKDRIVELEAERETWQGERAKMQGEINKLNTRLKKYENANVVVKPIEP